SIQAIQKRERGDIRAIPRACKTDVVAIETNVVSLNSTARRRKCTNNGKRNHGALSMQTMPRSPSPSHYTPTMLGNCCWKTVAAATASAMVGPLMIRTNGKMSSRPSCVSSSSRVVWEHPEYMETYTLPNCLQLTLKVRGHLVRRNRSSLLHSKSRRIAAGHRQNSHR